MTTERLLIVLTLLAVIAAVIVISRQRAARPKTIPTRVDPLLLGLNASHGDNAVIAFSGGLCHACQQWGEELKRAGIPYRRVDVLEEANLALSYNVTRTPVILVVERSSGNVLVSYTKGPNPTSVERVHALTAV